MLAIVVGLLVCNVIVASSQSVAVATFNDPNGAVRGTVRFSEVADGLQVQVSLSGINGTAAHPWHVHVYQLNSSYTYPATCDSAGGHFNPFNVNTSASTYAADCAANASLCEAGDLAGKSADIPAAGTIGDGIYVKTFVDTSGTLRVSDCIGRSVVIHKLPPPATAVSMRECANIYAFVAPSPTPLGAAHAVTDGVKLVALLALLALVAA